MSLCKVSIAYSPDSDDAFMIYALKEKKISWQDFDFQFVAMDIQKLNEKSLDAEFDISAISFAVLSEIKHLYELMPVGASVGRGYGPALVVPTDSPLSEAEQLHQRKIAVPGKWTSAYWAARYTLPSFTPIFSSFLEIENKVLTREVDAGILIHERQIDFEKLGLRKIDDLGTLWTAKTSLPLPLGGNVIRTSLPEDTKERLVSLYRQSIAWALDRKDEIAPLATQSAVAGLDNVKAADYISRFANEDSLDLQSDVVEAIVKLLAAKREMC